MVSSAARARSPWWVSWRRRFGLAELGGSIAWAIGVAAGLSRHWPIPAIAYAASIAEAAGFYLVLAIRTLPLGWGASLRQLTSAGWAEAADSLVIRPWLMTWLAIPLGLPGMVLGKVAADIVWYAAEAPANAAAGAVARAWRANREMTLAAAWCVAMSAALTVMLVTMWRAGG